MKKTTLIITIFLTLSLLTTSVMARPAGQLDKSRQQILILNLLNSLYLTEEQSQFVLARAQEAQQLQEEEELALQVKEEEREHIFAGIKEDLQKDNFVTDNNRRAHFSVKKDTREIRKQYQAQYRQLAQEIEKKLTNMQKIVIDEYKPCIIPPKGPARIGQAADNTQLQKKLERLYQLPEDTYEERKSKIIQRTIDRWKQHKRHSQADEEKLEQQLAQFYDKVRNLPEL